MTKALGFALMAISMSATAFGRVDLDVPEIDASMGGSALALISGGLLVLRSRRAKK